MRRRTALMLVLFLGVLCWAVVSFKPRGPVQTCRLPDGTTLKLQTVTWNEPHRYDPRPWWERFVPNSGKSVVDLLEVSPSTPVAWLEREGRPRGNYHFELSVADEHGCETGLGDLSFRGERSTDGGYDRSAFPVVLSHVPSRGRRISLRIRHLWPNVGYKPAGEFRLPLSTPLTGRDLQPVQLAASSQAGPVTLILKRFVTGASIFDPDQLPWGGTLDDAATHVWVEVRENGKPSKDWDVINFEAIDGTGNRFGEPGYCNPERDGAVTHLTYSANLFREVPEWLIRLEAARVRGAVFSSAELWTVRNVPLPRRGDPPMQVAGPPLAETVRLGQAAQLDGIMWGSAGPPSAQVVVTLPHYKPPGMMVRLVRAVDDRGRSVEVPEEREDYSYFGSGANATTFRLPLRITRKIKSVDLTFAIQKTIFAEVMGTPEPPAAK